jgi:hypothetical protein
MAEYWRTVIDKKTRVHLYGLGDSYTLCGLDTAGDDTVHDRQPEALEGKKRVTCEDCQQIISIVKGHLKKD